MCHNVSLCAISFHNAEYQVFFKKSVFFCPIFASSFEGKGQREAEEAGTRTKNVKQPASESRGCARPCDTAPPGHSDARHRRRGFSRRKAKENKIIFQTLKNNNYG